MKHWSEKLDRDNHSCDLDSLTDKLNKAVKFSNQRPNKINNAIANGKKKLKPRAYKKIVSLSYALKELVIIEVA